MSSIGTGYDLSSSTFSPDGRLFQIEYAKKAVEKSGTVLGITCKDGVVLGVAKSRISKMQISSKKIHAVRRHLGVAIAGIQADGRQIVSRGKSEAKNFFNFYGEEISSKEFCERVASFVHLNTAYPWLRPLGSSLLVAGYDCSGPSLYVIEPSGECFRYFGAAAGKGRQEARSELEKLDLSGLSCKEGVVALIKIIHHLHSDEELADLDIELSWLCDASNKELQNVPCTLLEEALAAAARKEID